MGGPLYITNHFGILYIILQPSEYYYEYGDGYGQGVEHVDEDGHGQEYKHGHGQGVEHVDEDGHGHKYEHGLWYKHKCFLNMGDHWLQFSHDVNQTCDDGILHKSIYYYSYPIYVTTTFKFKMNDKF